MPRAWSRAIRFIAQEDGQTYYGEPVDQGDIGLIYHDYLQQRDTAPALRTRVLSSSPLDPAGAQITDRQLTVERLLSPLSPDEVPSIRGLGIQYPPTEKTPVPALFLKPVDGLVGPEVPVVLPPCVEGEQADYEVEVGLVVGRTCRDVSRARALDVLAGFATVNDVSSRGLARKGVQFGMGKCFDTWTPFGPVLVSLAGLRAAGLDPDDLQLETRVNGSAPTQSSNTSQMHYSIRDIVHELTKGATLKAGTLIMTGSPLAVPGSRNPDGPFLQHGDEMRLFVQGLGTLINPVVEEKLLSKTAAKAKL